MRSGHVGPLTKGIPVRIQMDNQEPFMVMALHCPPSWEPKGEGGPSRTLYGTVDDKAQELKFTNGGLEDKYKYVYFRISTLLVYAPVFRWPHANNQCHIHTNVTMELLR